MACGQLNEANLGGIGCFERWGGATEANLGGIGCFECWGGAAEANLGEIGNGCYSAKPGHTFEPCFREFVKSDDGDAPLAGTFINCPYYLGLRGRVRFFCVIPT